MEAPDEIGADRVGRPEQTPVTVVIGSFDPLTLRGLDSALAEDRCVRVLGSDLQGPGLEDAVKHGKPSVVILDDAVAHSLIARLKSRRPAPGVLILGTDRSELSRTTLLAVGARCVAHSTSIERLIEEVHRAAHQRCGSGAQTGAGRALAAGMHRLTDRELDVLELLSRGVSYVDAAREMGLSVSTVKTHAAQIKRKLDVRSKRDLIGIESPPRTGRDRNI
jgi:DNA-binding NarL/FixJ family response regulator